MQGFDLVYHVLAHMQVPNASNLYSAEYVKKIQEEKKDGVAALPDALQSLQAYYLQHFDRLGMINFLPFENADLLELKRNMEAYSGFSEMDQCCFVGPFMGILEKEHAFYAGYWRSADQKAEPKKAELEQYFRKNLMAYHPLFDYFNKAAVILFSHSMTCNGRGYGNDCAFLAAVPFPEEQIQYEGAFFQLLHEYTHQITDSLIGSISMADESHMLSEKAVLLFDYDLIRYFQPDRVQQYLAWIAMLFQADSLDERMFLSALPIPSALKQRMNELLQKIISK